MKGTTAFVLVIGCILWLALSCVSTPQVNQNDSASATGESTAAKTNPAGNVPEPDNASGPEVSSPAAQPEMASAFSLSEPPQLFPEASAIPIQPGLSSKSPVTALPSPTAPDMPPNTATTATGPAGPQGSEIAGLKPESKGPSSSSSPAGTAQTNALTGSASAAEKKALPVDPRSLSAPEPKNDTSTAQEAAVMPVGGIPELPSKTNPALAEERVVLSRSVRATVGQLVEIPYQGSGWVYLGEVNGKKGLAYDSRRLDPEGQTFIFRCESAGTYRVKFFKQDFIKDYIINDYVEVVIGENSVTAPSAAGAFSLPVNRGRVVANPRWPAPENYGSASPAAASPVAASPAAASPAAPVGQGAAPATAASPATSATAAPTATASPTTATTTPPPTISASSASAGGTAQPLPSTAAARQSDSPVSAVENLSQPEDFINLAKTQVNAGQYASALATLQAFTAQYPAGSDEAWWLFGQIFEAKGPQRDIKGALTYYRRLVNEYPQSLRYEEAQKRIAYLERFYFDIR